MVTHGWSDGVSFQGCLFLHTGKKCQREMQMNRSQVTKRCSCLLEMLYSSTDCRSQLFRWKPGDPSGRTRDHRRADHLLLHLPGRDVAHSPPGNLRAASQAQPHTQPQHGAPRGDRDQAEREEAVCPQAGCDTMSDGLTVSDAEESHLSFQLSHWTSFSFIYSLHKLTRDSLLKQEAL